MLSDIVLTLHTHSFNPSVVSTLLGPLHLTPTYRHTYAHTRTLVDKIEEMAFSYLTHIKYTAICLINKGYKGVIDFLPGGYYRT